MTALAPAPGARHGVAPPPAASSSADRRRRRAARRDGWRDTLEATAWLAGTGAVALALASGTLDVTTPAGTLITLGRLTGMAASTLILTQLVLIARIPAVERAVGHDRAARVHGRLGRLGFLVILAHAALLIAGYAMSAGAGVLDQTWQFVVGYGTPMLLASVGLLVLIAVVVTSYAAVRRRWQYETWHAVHVFSYLAVGLSVPHQLTDGSTFRAMGFAWWYWVVLWSVAAGGLLVFRVGRPLARHLRHRLTVAFVDPLPDGSTVIAMRGRRLGALHARPGQFLLFRFLERDIWGQAHPYSLSRAPREEWLRITVKPLGDHSARLASIRPGTRVMVEGPLGTFTDRERAGGPVVLAGAGIGIAPIVAMLDGAELERGRCTVIVRASSAADAPHLDEVMAFAEQRGFAVHVLLGPRGDGWTPAAQPVRLRDLVPDLADADVYACGPEPWVGALLDEAEQEGVPRDRLHTEAFAW